MKDEKLAAARIHEWTLIRDGKDVAEGMVEYHKQFVDREAIRENLKLSTTQRMANLQEAASRADIGDRTERDARTVEFQKIAELEVLGEEIAKLSKIAEQPFPTPQLNGIWSHFPSLFAPCPAEYNDFL